MFSRDFTHQIRRQSSHQSLVQYFPEYSVPLSTQNKIKATLQCPLKIPPSSHLTTHKTLLVRPITLLLPKITGSHLFSILRSCSQSLFLLPRNLVSLRLLSFLSLLLQQSVCSSRTKFKVVRYTETSLLKYRFRYRDSNYRQNCLPVQFSSIS